MIFFRGVGSTNHGTSAMFGSSFVFIPSKKSGPQKLWLVRNKALICLNKVFNKAIKKHGHRGFVACHIPQGWHQTFWSIPWNLGQPNRWISPLVCVVFRVCFGGPNTSGGVWMSRVENNMENAANSDMTFQ